MTGRRSGCFVVSLSIAITTLASVRGAVSEPAEHTISQFLAHDRTPRSYRATRRLEAENGSQRGWVEAVTEFSTDTGFRYRITAEGGSGTIRSRVLKPVLDGEQDLVAHGDAARVSLAPANYRFELNGIDENGLAQVRLWPRRQEPALVAGTMYLRPGDGAIVRLQGRLAKSPSFWVKNVDIVRTYQRLQGAVVPVALETRADVRFRGEATLRMTYAYSEIDGRPLRGARVVDPVPAPSR